MKKANVVTQMLNYREEVNQEKYFKPRLFTFPDTETSGTVFDYDDLQNEDQFYVLCVRKQPDEGVANDTCYIWKGREFDGSDSSMNLIDFVNKVISNYWSSAADVNQIDEEPGEESDDFLNYFD